VLYKVNGGGGCGGGGDGDGGTVKQRLLLIWQ